MDLAPGTERLRPGRGKAELNRRQEVAVMGRISVPTRPWAWARTRLLGLLMAGPWLAGCAAVTQDVRDYYRQMADNYQEARDKAKLDEARLENVSRMLAATGDTAKYRRNQRRLERIRSWESRCAKQEERFEKAAVWMESHFDLKRPKAEGEPAARGASSGDPDAASSPLSEVKAP